MLDSTTLGYHTMSYNRSTLWRAVVILLLLVLILTGCGTTSEVVVKTDTKLIETPRHLLKKCPVTPPPSRTEYPKGSPEKKEDDLTQYSNKLLTDLNNCNKQIDEIGAYQEREKQLIKDAKK